MPGGVGAAIRCSLHEKFKRLAAASLLRDVDMGAVRVDRAHRLSVLVDHSLGDEALALVIRQHDEPGDLAALPGGGHTAAEAEPRRVPLSTPRVAHGEWRVFCLKGLFRRNRLAMHMPCRHLQRHGWSVNHSFHPAEGRANPVLRLLGVLEHEEKLSPAAMVSNRKAICRRNYFSTGTVETASRARRSNSRGRSMVSAGTSK